VYSNTALTLKGGFDILSVLGSKLCFDKLAQPAAYGGLMEREPGGSSGTRFDVIRKLGCVQRYVMPQYVLPYRPGKQKCDV
jgi:hypothetical protein